VHQTAQSASGLWISILTDSTNDGRLSVVLGGNVIRVQGTEPLQVGGRGRIGGVNHCNCGVNFSAGVVDGEKKRWCSGIFGYMVFFWIW
jgi:hypothetical protein